MGPLNRASLRRAVRAGAVAVLIATVVGCAVSPPSVSQQPPSAAAPTAPQATVVPSSPSSPSPTATAAVASGIGSAWDPISGIPAQAALVDGVYGDGRWVAVGACGKPICDLPKDSAAAWSSRDGRTWRIATVEKSANANFQAVTWNGMFYASGDRWTDTGDVRTTIWRSADGAAWEVVGNLRRGNCGQRRCLSFALAASSSGVLVLGWEEPVETTGPGTYWSADGSTWAKADLPAFGGKSDAQWPVVDVIARDDGFVLAGACQTCPATVWSSADGRRWTQGPELGSNHPTRVDLLAAGGAIFAFVRGCMDKACDVQAWRSNDGTRWEHLGAIPDGAAVAYSNGSLVDVYLSGEDGRVLRSTDAAVWVDVVATGLEMDFDCGVMWVAGGPDGVLLGHTDCSEPIFSGP